MTLCKQRIYSFLYIIWDEGRGFAVVATEVRKLAENSKKMSSHIKEQIQKSDNQSSVLVDTMNSMNLSTKESQTRIQQVKGGLVTVKMEMEQYLGMFGRNKNDQDSIVQSIQESIIQPKDCQCLHRN